MSEPSTAPAPPGAGPPSGAAHAGDGGAAGGPPGAEPLSAELEVELSSGAGDELTRDQRTVVLRPQAREREEPQRPRDGGASDVAVTAREGRLRLVPPRDATPAEAQTAGAAPPFEPSYDASPSASSGASGPAAIADRGDASPARADPLIGMVIAERYRIVEAIGRGGMGFVYKVEHVRIGKLLAMKLISGELSHQPHVSRRFRQEALAISRLSSPNTVQVFDFGVSEGLTYLVMELVNGETFSRLLSVSGPMPFARLGGILIQVCSSLAEAHRQGVVHRDIKLENIMLVRAHDGTDLAKVLDFGLAKLREGSDLNAVTSQGTILGTPNYMPPEQASGEAVDTRADIYALGVVMYRALTRTYPFRGETPMRVLWKHVNEPPTPPEVRAPDLAIPPGVSRIVMRALAKRPEDRFQRAEDMQRAIVDEMVRLGETSAEMLIDSSAMWELVEIEPGRSRALEIATRDEVEAYERKLRRMRRTAVGSAVAAAACAGLVAARLLTLPSTPRFTGAESEPNDTAAEATPTPLGEPVSGTLGKRIDEAHGDRDLYAFALPAASTTSGVQAHVRLSLTALPHLATCAMLYRVGLQGALGQYCVGRARLDLVIPDLRLEPGRYLLAVQQDMDGHGGATPFVQESISDRYTLRIDPAEPRPGEEVEPNDQVSSAAALSPGASLSGALAWSRDEDVVCVAEEARGAVRWRVQDGTREPGAVLEVTPMRGAEAGAPVRVHAGAMRVEAPTAADVGSPWTSEAIAEGGEPRCLRLRLAGDPWAGEHRELSPSGSSEPYLVEVEAE